ncbi:DUF397 domain-containing protein [Streptomyces niveus]|uniref:DUF397 domain-containing protein n=1 Tax=Streptomyces niveus TaxID=193462 RepID=UPI00341AA9C7
MSAALDWQKSSFSGGDDNQDCIELAEADSQILLRESNAPGTIITTDRAKLRAFLLGVKPASSTTSSADQPRPAARALPSPDGRALVVRTPQACPGAHLPPTSA